MPGSISRRFLIKSSIAIPLAYRIAGSEAFAASEHDEKAIQLLEKYPSIDIHAHAGRPWQPQNKKIQIKTWRYRAMEKRIEQMKEGGLTASVQGVVSDFRRVKRSDGKFRFSSKPKSGVKYVDECCFRYDFQFENLKRIFASGKASQIDSPDTLIQSHRDKKPGFILAVEGGDALRGNVDAVKEAYDKGVKLLQLIHNKPNELGDTQTNGVSAVHNGLSEFGISVIKKMNGLGMIIDLAHATFDAVKAATEATSKPVILSHTHLGSGTPRAISKVHARLISDTGGVVGIWQNISCCRSRNDYVKEIFKMVDVVGVDHVGIGTDLDGAKVPWSPYSPYSKFYNIPSLLLKRGMAEKEVAKIIGGNFLRVWGDVNNKS